MAAAEVAEEEVIVAVVRAVVVVPSTSIAKPARRESMLVNIYLPPVSSNEEHRDSEKKIHQGWGGDEGKSELKAENDGTKDAAAEVPSNDWASPAGNADDAWGPPTITNDAAATDAPTEGRPRREEEEDNTLTLDQYLAKQKENTIVPKLESVRQANDGADDLFKDAVKVVKDEEDAYFAGKVGRLSSAYIPSG